MWRPRRAAAIALGSVALLELCAAPLPVTPLPEPGAIERRLAHAAGSAGVLPVPFGIRDGFGQRGSVDHAALYLQTFHRQPLAGGFVARVAPRIWETYEEAEPFRSLLRLSEGTDLTAWPSCAEVVEGLRSSRIAFVVVNGEAAPARTREFVRTLPLQRIEQEGSRELFVLRDGASCESSGALPGNSAERPN
jgi:hypothetical protein